MGNAICRSWIFADGYSAILDAGYPYSIVNVMADLTVHDLEEEIIVRLREEARRENISDEEAHRRLLRRTLLGSPSKPPMNLKDFLRTMPDFPDEYDSLFERLPDPLEDNRIVEF